MRIANPPPVPSLPATDRPRPLLSVMIPSYEPGPYLVETLASILAQDLGPEVMQIAVIDDASPTVDVEQLIAKVAPPGRLEVHRNASNLGLAGNWNRSIALARGEFLHLLHQDDLTLPGFYSRLLQGFAVMPATGMAFSRHAFVDESGRWTRRSHRERWRPGILEDWLERISLKQRIQCPAAIVRRSVYEKTGGFRSDLDYALDWEMWVRIAAGFPVWYEPRILACYRRHSGSETSRLSASGKVGADVLRAIGIFSQHLPPESRARLGLRAYRHLVRALLRDAAKILDGGATDPARQQLEIARAALQKFPDDLGKRWRERQLLRLEDFCRTRAAR